MMNGSMPKITRRHFTLFEILVCFVILGMISALMFGAGNSLLQHHKFRHSVRGLIGRLALCSEIASCYQTDVQVVLKQVGNDIELSCTVLDTIEKSLKTLLMQKKLYPGIKKIILDDEQTDNAYIQFSSNRCLQNKLTLYSFKEEEMVIDISGILIPAG